MRSLRLAFMCVLVVLLLQLVGSSAFADSAALNGVTPEADAFVRGTTGNQDTNFNGQGLSVAASALAACSASDMSYIRFDVTGQSTSGTWRLILGIGSTRTPNSVIGVFSVSDDTWQENTITWNNKPDTGATALATALVPAVGAGDTIEFSSAGLDSFIDSQIGGTDNKASIALKVVTCVDSLLDVTTFKDRDQTPPPLSVVLLSFEAVGKPGSVVISWTTASELDNEGFNVYRSEAEDGEYVKINDALIPAQGNASTGASYSFTDTDVKPGRTYYYKLEDVDTSGASTFHGPVSATVRGKGR